MPRPGQRLLIVVIVAFSLAMLVPEITRQWLHLGSFGMEFSSSGEIVGVDPRAPASALGIHVGDRIDLPRTPLSSRRWIITGEAAAPIGTTSPFVIERAGTTRTVVLTAIGGDRTELDDATNVILTIAFITFVLIAGTLCFLSPSRMTWAFFAYAVVACLGGVVVVPTTASLEWYIPLQLLPSAQSAAGLILVLFALRFPDNRAPGWRHRAEKPTAIAIFATLLFGLYAYGKELLAPDGLIDAANTLLGVIEIAGTVAAIATFALTYAQSPVGDRARFRWVFAGLTVGQTGLIVFQVLTTVPAVTFAWPAWLINIVLTLQIAIPATIAYAVVRHRVFDVRVVVSRTLVYALLTAILVACVAAIKFAAGALLAQTRAAAILEVLVTIALGVGLNAGRKRVEGLVDSVLYRQRTRAGVRLRRLAGGLIHATSAASIADTVAREACDALELTSTALFRLGDGVYIRIAAMGWQDVPLAPLAIDAPAVLQMRGEATPVRFNEATWVGLPFPSGAGQPVLAIPITLRGTIEAIAFFGSHVSGEDIDGEEIVMLTQLLRAAGEALDKLSNEAMHERLAGLERQLIHGTSS